MKIRTLNPNNYCLANVIDGQFDLNCHLENCIKSLSREMVAFLSVSDNQRECISVCVAENEPFFCRIILFQNGKQINQADFVAHYANGRIVTDEAISGQRVNYEDEDKVLIFPYYPDNFTLYEHDQCIFTSDGLVELEQNTLLGIKDGRLDKLDADEVLKQLAAGAGANSPSYEVVKMVPTPTRPKRPKEGMMILNKVTGKLEVYSNKKWKSIKWED
jgi:hypothetical protein